MTHETRILSAAGTRLPVAMSAAFAFYGAVRFPGALHFSFFAGWRLVYIIPHPQQLFRTCTKNCILF